jgi:AcrR family transcriptional regulator
MQKTANKSVKPKRSAKRQRNPVATREAILNSARHAFTHSGYDGVGMREIARQAGVTATMVNRYFGTKEALFQEVVESTLHPASILTRDVTEGNPDLSKLSQEIASHLIAATKPHRTPIDSFLVMLRSAQNRRAAEILRKSFTVHFAKPLAARLGGSHAAERCGLIMSIIGGVQLMRQIITITGLVDADPAVLVEQVQELFDVLIAADPKKGSSSAKRR